MVEWLERLCHGEESHGFEFSLGQLLTENISDKGYFFRERIRQQNVRVGIRLLCAVSKIQ